MIVNNDNIVIIDPNTTHNYCGNGNELEQLAINLDGLEKSIQKYSELLI